MAGAIVAGLALALNWLADNWPVLLLVPLAQMVHELTHFAVAWYYDTEPIIVIRLRTPMRVVYDDSALSVVQRAAIGMAPAIAGLTALAAVFWSGMPVPETPSTAVAAVAWTLYTLPSRSDSAPLIEWLGPDEPLGEPQRSLIIGFGGMAIGAWIPAVPIDAQATFILSQSLIYASLAYLGLAFYEHGIPETDSAVN